MPRPSLLLLLSLLLAAACTPFETYGVVAVEQRRQMPAQLVAPER